MCDKDSPPYMPNVYRLLANGGTAVAPLSAPPPLPPRLPRVGATADELYSRLFASGESRPPDGSALNEPILSSLISCISNHLRPVQTAKANYVEDFVGKFDCVQTALTLETTKKIESSSTVYNGLENNIGNKNFANTESNVCNEAKHTVNQTSAVSFKAETTSTAKLTFAESRLTCTVASELSDRKSKSPHFHDMAVSRTDEIVKPKPLMATGLVPRQENCDEPHDLRAGTNASAFLPPVKRKKKPYKELTLEEKVELIRLAETNSALSQASIAERYAIAKSNVCRILQRRTEYLSAYESAGFAGSRKRKLRAENCAPPASNAEAKFLTVERPHSKANSFGDERKTEDVKCHNAERTSKLETVHQNSNHTAFIEPVSVDAIRTITPVAIYPSAQHFQSIDVLRAALLSISQQQQANSNRNNNSHMAGGIFSSLSPAAADDATVGEGAVGATSPTRIAARPAPSEPNGDVPARQFGDKHADSILDFSLRSRIYERNTGTLAKVEWEDHVVNVIDLNNNVKADTSGRDSNDQKHHRTVIITDQNSDTASTSSSSSAFASTSNSPIDLRNRHDDVHDKIDPRDILDRFRHLEQINSHLRSEVTQLRKYTQKYHDEMEALRRRNEQLQYRLISGKLSSAEFQPAKAESDLSGKLYKNDLD